MVLLSPFAVSSIGQLMLLAFIGFYAMRRMDSANQPGPNRHIVWTIFWFGIYLVFVILEHSLVQPHDILMNYCQSFPVSVAGLHLLRFAFAFHSMPASRIWKWEAEWVPRLFWWVPVFELSHLLFRLWDLHSQGEVTWRPLFADIQMNLLFCWAAAVLIRKAVFLRAQSSSPLPKGEAETDDTLILRAASHSAMSLGGLCVFLGVLILLNSRAILELPGEWQNIFINIGALISIYWFGIVAMNQFAARGSFQVRFVGFTLLTFLALVSAANWVVVGIYLQTRSGIGEDRQETRPLMVDSRQSWLAEPTVTGYRLRPRVAQRRFGLGQRVLEKGHCYAEKILELPFEFPFFGVPSDRLTVKGCGLLLPGVEGWHIDRLRWRYGSAPAILAGTAPFRIVNEHSDGVFVLSQDDVVVVTWSGQVETREGTHPRVVQVELHRDGRIAFNLLEASMAYPTTITSQLVVQHLGLTPGGSSGRLPTPINLTYGRLVGESDFGSNGFVWDAQRQLRERLHPLCVQVLGLTWIGSVAIVGLLPWWVRHTLLRPIRQLMEGIQDLNAGGPWKPIPSERRDEMGFLTQSFNHMAASIRASEAQLMAGKDQLERLVSVRTSELEAEIVRREKMAQELDRARVAAEAASTAKSEFLATMSHEIRTPMNGVIGACTLLDQTEMEPNQRELLQIARSSAEALMVILNDILDFSKIEAGQLSLNRIPVTLVPWLEGVLDVFTPTAHQKGLTIEYWIEPDVPQCVLADPDRLRQVLTNLLSNGIKFTGKGGLSVHMSRSIGTKDSPMLRLEVHDTGMGIPAEIQDRLFHPFTQGDNATTRRFGGTGLGLAISRRIIELMQGQIGLRSTPGQGSVFWFEIPIFAHGTETMAHWNPPVTGRKLTRLMEKLTASPTPTQQPNTQSTLPTADNRIPDNTTTQPQTHPDDLKPADPTSEPIPSSEIPVLVVEDNSINERILCRMLQRLGLSPDIARSGGDAQACADRKAYSIILMDYQLPDIHGLEVTRRIRKGTGASRDAFIVALTANSDPQDRAEGLAVGMSAFLAKPVRLGDLETMLKLAGSKDREVLQQANPMN